MTPRSGTRDVFDSSDPAEQARLRAHGGLWDDFTFRRLAATGLGAGWRCLEIGAGTGSVAEWMVERVGAAGKVVATDIETRWLESIAGPNLEVRHHNVTDDPLEDRGYDLIHARLVLEHLPQREAVVAKLVRALRPGGHLVVEDYDVRTMQLSDGAGDAWSRVNRALVDVLRHTGVDLACGRRLPELLRAAGLTDVTAEGLLHPSTIPELAPVFRPALEQVAPRLLDEGAITRQELHEVLAELEEVEQPACAYTPVLVAASGRAPTGVSAAAGG